MGFKPSGIYGPALKAMCDDFIAAVERLCRALELIDDSAPAEDEQHEGNDGENHENRPQHGGTDTQAVCDPLTYTYDLNISNPEPPAGEGNYVYAAGPTGIEFPNARLRQDDLDRAKQFTTTHDFVQELGSLDCFVCGKRRYETIHVNATTADEPSTFDVFTSQGYKIVTPEIEMVLRAARSYTRELETHGQHLEHNWTSVGRNLQDAFRAYEDSIRPPAPPCQAWFGEPGHAYNCQLDAGHPERHRESGEGWSVEWS